MRFAVFVRRLWLVFGVTSLAMTWAPHASANYPNQTPNYASFGCATCHNNASGGYGCPTAPCLTGFGTAFAANGHVWNWNLASQDSDGDGFTNGRELLDYWGDWRPGNVDPGPAGYATKPNESTAAMYECTINVVTVNGWTRDYALCASNAYCTEQSGPNLGYTCSCPSGYVAAGSPSGSICNDIDECSPSNPCGVGTCQNLTGSFTCNCPTGYGFNGATCTQDACARNVDNCNAGTTCIPDQANANNWTCACSSGFQNLQAACVHTTCTIYFCYCDTYSQTCSNIDECTVGSPPCASNSACVDTYGSHTCTPCGPNAHVVGAVNAESCVCDSGFQGDPLVACVDIDECVVANDCAVGTAACSNFPGGHSCACLPGYAGNGTSCADVDECATNTDGCSPDATCANAPGTHACTCNPGYYGDGRLCRDVDECAAGTDTCGVGEACVNGDGGFGCTCAPGYAEDGAGGCVGGCGNGILLTPERCDDGNVAAGDGCSPSCVVERGFACHESPAGTSSCEATCGNGRIDPPYETCDDAAGNSDRAANACRTNCERAHCGDGVPDSGEACDEGEANSSTAADACRPTCVPAFCGDGVIDSGEVCDPGTGTSLDVATCQEARCALGDAGVDGHGRSRGGCSAAPRTRMNPAATAIAMSLVLLALSWRRSGRASRRR